VLADQALRVRVVTKQERNSLLKQAAAAIDTDGDDIVLAETVPAGGCRS
jgi:hypothetical protein